MYTCIGIHVLVYISNTLSITIIMYLMFNYVFIVARATLNSQHTRYILLHKTYYLLNTIGVEVQQNNTSDEYGVDDT